MSGLSQGNSSIRIADLLSEGMKALAEAGIEAPGREARLLLGHASGTPATVLIGFPERSVDAPAAAVYRASIARRVGREPVSHILGQREFWSLPFLVTGAVLDPRPDSETLVASVLTEIGDRGRGLRLLDLGVGSGCLLLSLLKELPNASGLGIDASEAALAIAARNAQHLGLAGRARFLVGDWDAGLAEKFDIIVSNPPYIPSAEIDRLSPEVALFEPRLALDGGADGLAAYRALGPVLARRLKPDGLAAIEIGLGQSESVAAIFAGAGLAFLDCNQDFGMRDRCLLFRLLDK